MARKSPARGERGGGSWDLKEIRELIDLLIDREVSEFEMEKGGVRIRVRRGPALSENAAAAPAVLLSSSAPPAAPVNPPSAPSASDAVSAPAEATTGESTEGLYIVKSPIVGTFYPSPAPNASPFIKLGDVVHVGQVLCVIEAMKLMNEIESEVAGEIVRLYVENGQPVEYGQSLFAIKPSHKK